MTESLQEFERLVDQWRSCIDDWKQSSADEFQCKAALLSAITSVVQERDRAIRERDRWKFTADEQSKNVEFLRGKEQQAIRCANQECNDADDLIEQLGLNVEQCRTDGGWLNVPKIISKLKDDPPWTALAPQSAQTEGEQG